MFVIDNSQATEIFNELSSLVDKFKALNRHDESMVNAKSAALAREYSDSRRRNYPHEFYNFIYDDLTIMLCKHRGIYCVAISGTLTPEAFRALSCFEEIIAAKYPEDTFYHSFRCFCPSDNFVTATQSFFDVCYQILRYKASPFLNGYLF